MIYKFPAYHSMAPFYTYKQLEKKKKKDLKFTNFNLFFSKTQSKLDLQKK